MIIKNLTNKTQKIIAKEITGDRREFDIFLEPNGSTELNLMVLDDPSKYAGIIEIEGIATKTVAPIKEKAPVEETPVEVVTESVEEPVAETPAEEAPKSEGFICDICGEEFASARGLSTHKHKAHE